MAEPKQKLSEPKLIEKGVHTQCQSFVTFCEIDQMLTHGGKWETVFSLSEKGVSYKYMISEISFLIAF